MERTITFVPQGDRTPVCWRPLFDTAAEYPRVSRLALEANEQDPDRLAAHVLDMA